MPYIKTDSRAGRRVWESVFLRIKNAGFV